MLDVLGEQPREAGDAIGLEDRAARIESARWLTAHLARRTSAQPTLKRLVRLERVGRLRSALDPTILQIVCDQRQLGDQLGRDPIHEGVEGAEHHLRSLREERLPIIGASSGHT